MRRDDLANLAAGELVAPLARFAGAEEDFGFVGFLLEALLGFLLLQIQIVERGTLDGELKLFGARFEKKVAGERAEDLNIGFTTYL